MQALADRVAEGGAELADVTEDEAQVAAPEVHGAEAEPAEEGQSAEQPQQAVPRRTGEGEREEDTGQRDRSQLVADSRSDAHQGQQCLDGQGARRAQPWWASG